MNSAILGLLMAIPSPINEIADQLGANDLPYSIPIHPNLVHFTIGLFATISPVRSIHWRNGCSAFWPCR